MLNVHRVSKLATLASLPPLAVTSLISFQLITPSERLAIGLALLLLTADISAWHVISRLFDRERLIAGPPRPPRRTHIGRTSVTTHHERPQRNLSLIGSKTISTGSLVLTYRPS
jgi:hypothetical protein